jgi:hypothetical protein
MNGKEADTGDKVVILSIYCHSLIFLSCFVCETAMNHRFCQDLGHSNEPREMQLTESFNDFMFSNLTNFAVDRPFWPPSNLFIVAHSIIVATHIICKRVIGPQ